eukprot:gnl/Trimastix_PCT/1280.p1 GENE.gnl/Trimastix_PCT/1280~~gnl/Trimastix_PCT/1280.p1  ORF type:complete len:532 (+),score=133.72 gnl/Trimastix_PCT/1280:155-1750(+)
MSHTAHTTPEQMEEHYESPEQMRSKARRIAQMIRSSNHCVFFTGAGVSTSTGIPDFRGPQGVWTLAAKGEQRTERAVDTLAALPSLTHMAMVTLIREGRLKFVISQNCDGLHRRSGIPSDKIAELHGNTNIERCTNPSCKKEYFRDYHVRRAHGVFEHETGAHCRLCGAPLVDTIVNFGENLPTSALEAGFRHAGQADLLIALGSSLTVTPAADMPREVGRRRRHDLVICNKQITPLDNLASLRVFGNCDDLMRGVMEELGLPIHPWRLHRHVIVHHDAAQGRCSVQGCDEDGVPASIFESVEYGAEGGTARRTREPFEFVCFHDETARVRLTFFGHYGEPPLDLPRYSLREPLATATYDLVYSPEARSWDVTQRPERDNLPLLPPVGAAPLARPSASGDVARRPAVAPLDPPGMFAVEPKRDCPHVARLAAVQPEIEMRPCEVCGDNRENWICLLCNRVFCSRYVNEHMLQHYQENTEHCIGGSFSDLSFWCFACDSYIEAPELAPLKVAMEIAKFGEPSAQSMLRIRSG